LPCCNLVAIIRGSGWKGNSYFLTSHLKKIRKALPGTDSADTTFYFDHYLVKTAAAESKWHYDKILALAETQDYLLLVMGMNHAMAIEKSNLEGGNIPEFRHFLEEKSAWQS
jgi:hypothetical protein